MPLLYNVCFIEYNSYNYQYDNRAAMAIMPVLNVMAILATMAVMPISTVMAATTISFSILVVYGNSCSCSYE